MLFHLMINKFGHCFHYIMSFDNFRPNHHFMVHELGEVSNYSITSSHYSPHLTHAALIDRKGLVVLSKVKKGNRFTNNTVITM